MTTRSEILEGKKYCIDWNAWRRQEFNWRSACKEYGHVFCGLRPCNSGAGGEKLHELIEENGLEGFLAIESRVNAALHPKTAVIATGGSAIYSEQAMEHLRSIAMVVYLKLPYESIQERLGDLTERGVVLREGLTLRGLYEERVPLYEKYANMTVDCENKNIREIVTELAKRLK